MRIKLPEGYRFRRGWFGKCILQDHRFLPECVEGGEVIREAGHHWLDTKMEDIV